MSEMLYEFVEVVRVCRLRQIANRPLLVAHVVSTPTYDQGRALEDSLPEAVRLLELWIVHGDATNIIRARSTQPPSNVKLGERVVADRAGNVIDFRAGFDSPRHLAGSNCLWRLL